MFLLAKYMSSVLTQIWPTYNMRHDFNIWTNSGTHAENLPDSQPTLEDNSWNEPRCGGIWVRLGPRTHRIMELYFAISQSWCLTPVSVSPDISDSVASLRGKTGLNVMIWTHNRSLTELLASPDSCFPKALTYNHCFLSLCWFTLIKEPKLCVHSVQTGKHTTKLVFNYHTTSLFIPPEMD